MNKEQQEKRKKSPVQIGDKKTPLEYFFVDTYTAGIVLTGTEIKSIYAGKASLVGPYCYIAEGEMQVQGMSISSYFYGSCANHKAKRPRKLLLTRKEMRNLESESETPGFTVIPTLIFIDENRRTKVDIALIRGKKEYDRRQTLREKGDRRGMDRAKKHY